MDERAERQHRVGSVIAALSEADDPLPALPLGSDSVMWRVSTEPAFLAPAGPRALLLQVAHPVVAAGVADHSDYERRPWVRLIATLHVMNRMAFGTPEGSAAVVRDLRRRHAEITGSLADGEPYRALDGENMLWVWATLVDTLVTSYQRYVRDLTEVEMTTLYREWRAIGRACGVPLGLMPDSWDGFGRYFDGVVGTTLGPTRTATVVAEQVRRPPLPRPLGPASGHLLSALTAPVLPEALRVDLGFGEPTGAGDRIAARARWVAAHTPDAVRQAPLRLVLSVWARPPKFRRRPVA